MKIIINNSNEIKLNLNKSVETIAQDNIFEFKVPDQQTTYLIPKGFRFKKNPEQRQIKLLPWQRYSIKVKGKKTEGDIELRLIQYSVDDILLTERITISSNTEEFLINTHYLCEQCALVIKLQGKCILSNLDIEITNQGSIPEVNNFALIIGAMKSGTTTLYDYLRQHPQICPNSKSKEPDFFSSTDNFSLDSRDYYLQYKFEPKIHRYALEASTHYAKYPTYKNVPERIKKYTQKFNHCFKLIYILRDPISRIESHIAHKIATGESTLSNYKDSMDHAIHVSRYATQMDRFKQIIPEQNILLLDFEELKKEPINLVEKVASFLELDNKFEFQIISAKNKRKFRNGSETFHLSEKQKSNLKAILKDETERCKNYYGVDVSRW